MRRKVLQDYANKVCEIFAGWRLAVSSSDIPALIAAGQGEIEIDLLSGVATLDGEVVDGLGIAGELQAWLVSPTASRWTTYRLMACGSRS